MLRLFKFDKDCVWSKEIRVLVRSGSGEDELHLLGNEHCLHPFTHQAKISLGINGNNPVAFQIVNEFYTKSSLIQAFHLFYYFIYATTQPAFNELLLHDKHCAKTLKIKRRMWFPPASSLQACREDRYPTSYIKKYYKHCFSHNFFS